LIACLKSVALLKITELCFNVDEAVIDDYSHTQPDLVQRAAGEGLTHIVLVSAIIGVATGPALIDCLGLERTAAKAEKIYLHPSAARTHKRVPIERAVNE